VHRRVNQLVTNIPHTVGNVEHNIDITLWLSYVRINNLGPLPFHSIYANRAALKPRTTVWETFVYFARPKGFGVTDRCVILVSYNFFVIQMLSLSDCMITYYGRRPQSLWGRVLIKKLIIAYLVYKFHSLCGTRRFIFMFARACCWIWARWNQSTSSRPSLFLHYAPIYT
jgi:hypothetical protein